MQKTPFLVFTTAALALSLAASPTRAAFLLQPHDTLAICGDSITQQIQYSAYIEDYLLMSQPVEGLRVAQFGWNGETAGGYHAKLQADLFPFKPTVVTTCFGMNDGAYRAIDDNSRNFYHDNLSGIAIDLKKGGVRTVVLGSPGCVDSTIFGNTNTPAAVYNETLDTFRGIAQAVAEKEEVNFADVHTPMVDVMTKAKAAYGSSYPFIIGGGVHPEANGHIVMAYAFLKALGCDGAIGTLAVDLGANQATGTPGQKILSCQNGSVEIESTRYPFCFQGDPDKPDQTDACVLKFFPFNDDLNRYVLVVKGLKGAKAKVTWGATSKEFAAADLEKGINLAAEFLSNPFCDQFNKVHAAVRAQQINETALVQQCLYNAQALKDLAPSEAASVDKIAAAGLQHDKDLFDAAAALVIPIHHTIKIEAEL